MIGGPPDTDIDEAESRPMPNRRLPMAEKRRSTVTIDPEHLRILKIIETDLGISVEDQLGIALDDYILDLKKRLLEEKLSRQANKRDTAKKWTH